MADADTSVWNDAPSVLIFGNDARGRDRSAALAAGVGARVIGAEPLGLALDRLARQVAVDAVLIELDEWTDDDSAVLLDWAAAAVREHFTSVVIAFPAPLLDRVVARIDEPGVDLLCAASAEDRVTALAFALVKRRFRLHDHGAEPDAERLRRLSEEVARIAHALSDLAGGSRMPPQAPPAPGQEPVGPPLEAETVRAMIRLRRLRGQFLDPALFADPAWDMLLDLMAARLDGNRVAVSSLCIAASVPPTTALRWIRSMTEQGVFVRRLDPGDGRRVFIELSDTAAAAMTAWFAEARELGWRPGPGAAEEPGEPG